MLTTNAMFVIHQPHCGMAYVCLYVLQERIRIHQPIVVTIVLLIVHSAQVQQIVLPVTIVFI